MSISKRNLLLGGAVGLGAAALGASAALRQSPHALALSPAAQAFWAARFATLAGGDLRTSSFAGRPLLVNFWAPWCAPCVKELPEIEQFYRESAAADPSGKGWQVIGLAVDSADAVKAFLQKLPLSFPQGLAGLTGSELTRTLGNAQGGLPFSVAFGRDGEPIWTKIGATHLAELRQLAASHS